MTKGVILCGAGKVSSILSFTGTTDGIRATQAINSSTPVFNSVRDIGIYTSNTLNTGAAYADVGGSFLDVDSVYIEGFKYGFVLDQTELATISHCDIESPASGIGIWLLNGADHTALASPGYTNRITISNNQFNGNSSAIAIVDDGGSNHLIFGNNFNGYSTHIRACQVYGLTIDNNELESSGSYPILFEETTFLLGTRVGGPNGFTIKDNVIGTVTPANIYIKEAYNGLIASNIFYFATTCAVDFDYGTSNFKIAGINFSGNQVSNTGASKTATPLVTTTNLATWKAQGFFLQNHQSYSVGAVAVGAQTVTPGSMCGIVNGTLVRCVNADGTNQETVTASGVTGTTFDATFASSKSANFRIFTLNGL